MIGDDSTSSRREILQGLIAGASTLNMTKSAGSYSHIPASDNFDVAVVGAGVFGSWIAYTLLEHGRRVVLVDQYGAASSRASSGGESRIIRMGYGPDEIYTRWAQYALERWKELAEQTNQQLFRQTGVLWMAKENAEQLVHTVRVLTQVGIPFEKLSLDELVKRYPQFRFGSIETAIFEPGSGALMARRAVQTLTVEAVKKGLQYRIDAVEPLVGSGRLAAVRTASGNRINADNFVFACGPWFPKVFPDVLAHRIFPTRQEVFYLGIPAADLSYSPPAMPTWIDLGTYYGLPDLENRGFKVAVDKHGPAFDPDLGERIPSQESIAALRQFVAERFPRMSDAPIVESRVCQYENTSNGDFLIDRHPAFENVWLAGGGSGHGFKHGPAIGRYVAEKLLGVGPVEERFSLKSKNTNEHRAIY